MAKIRNIPNACKDMGKLDHTYISGGIDILESSLQFL